MGCSRGLRNQTWHAPQLNAALPMAVLEVRLEGGRQLRALGP